MQSGKQCRIIAVGGGKGGVGKTVFAANVAIAIASRGHRTTLVDADLGGANVHTVLGVSPPAQTISDFIARDVGLENLAVPTPFANLSFISGAMDDAQAANPKYQQKMRLLRHLAMLDTDYLIIDLGAGTGFNVLDFFLLADDGVLVVLPEPTSVENAYRFLKGAFFRRLRAVERAYDIRSLVDAAMARRNQLGIYTPADLLRVIEERDPRVGAEVRGQMKDFRPRLLVNQVSVSDPKRDEQISIDMASACRRFFGVELSVLGHLPHDPVVQRCIRDRRPYYVECPDSQIRIALDGVTDRLLRNRRSVSAEGQAA